MYLSSLRQSAIALLCLGCTLCVPTSAQIDNGLPGPQPLDAGALILSDNMMRLNMGEVGSRGTSSSSARRAPRGTRNTRPSSARAVFTTTYRADPSVSRRVKSQYLVWARQRNAKEAAALQRVFVQHDPISVWQNLVASYGLHTGDSADALSAYWLLNHLLANGGKEPTRRQTLAVRAQVRSALARNAAFGRLSPAKRQEVSELWMLNYVVQQGAYSAATRRGDKVMLQKLARAAKARFQAEMQVDLLRLTLTDRGFVPRT